jgi:hypothetical protein
LVGRQGSAQALLALDIILCDAAHPQPGLCTTWIGPQDPAQYLSTGELVTGLDRGDGLPQRFPLLHV